MGSQVVEGCSVDMVPCGRLFIFQGTKYAMMIQVFRSSRLSTTFTLVLGE